MVQQSVIKSVHDYLVRLSDEGIAVSFGVIFGSYAAGTATDLSDIDLLVVSPLFDEQFQRESVHKLWRLAARTDTRIEPIPCGKLQWENDTKNAVIEIARTEGQTVMVN